ncbi:helix-turn-helix transcriptional regulator [Ruegeria sp. 2012CJ41-6]|uniref:Helix-turn-helix transcriptional regulator n=1 Tax=Ruegeria spongiae TaxID=2942209 RepID=A0ABT0Q027_9RHOB|nr:helix-turn-helix transcriptional regulator [Ruegeria spongiae]MCL6283185.1 helix-turn-helix transcriptional regulator [Ruegeria spongiae]
MTFLSSFWIWRQNVPGEVIEAITCKVTDAVLGARYAAPMTEFPSTLKTWRAARRMSQLQLAVEAEVSSRHISFLETGRARPSREMIGRLGDALQMPLDARNQMLLTAGFAPRYPQRRWEADEMAPIRDAVAHMLDTHAPYPGLAVDRLWSVLRMNAPARLLYGPLGLTEGGSMLDLLMSDHLPGHIENWPAVAHHAARRLRIESAAQGGVARLDAVAEHLAQVPPPSDRSLAPVVPTILRAGKMRLVLFATIAQFGTPEDLLLDDLKVELYFPADPESGAVLCALAQNGG